MFCENCGKSNADTAKFCGHCGNPLHSATSEQDATNNAKVRTPVLAPSTKESGSRSVAYDYVIAVLGVIAIGGGVWGAMTYGGATRQSNSSTSLATSAVSSVFSSLSGNLTRETAASLIQRDANFVTADVLLQ